jgi:GAF domain-containing protein
MAQADNVQVLQERLAYEQKLVRLVDRIHGAKSLDAIFIELQGDILALLDAERLTLFAIDPEKRELYSKFVAIDAIKEIRVPISEQSLAGYVATTGQTLNIADAYDAAELARISSRLRFDSSWDKKTGFRTTQILCMPIQRDDGTTLGVVQLLNKRRGPRFTAADEESVARITKTLGIASTTSSRSSWASAGPASSTTCWPSTGSPRRS